jgi:hypothetical protein
MGGRIRVAGLGPFGLTTDEAARLAAAGITEIGLDDLADLRVRWQQDRDAARVRAGGAPSPPPTRRRTRKAAGAPVPAACYYPSEHDEQAGFFARIDWICATYPDQYPDLGAIFAVPNGGERPATEDANGNRVSVVAARMRDEGLRAGVPDLCIPVPRAPHPGAFLETKRRRGAPSRIDPDQVVWITRLLDLGWFVRVCYGEAELWRTATEYLGYTALIDLFTNPGSGL